MKKKFLIIGLLIMISSTILIGCSKKINENDLFISQNIELLSDGKLEDIPKNVEEITPTEFLANEYLYLGYGKGKNYNYTYNVFENNKTIGIELMNGSILPVNKQIKIKAIKGNEDIIKYFKITKYNNNENTYYEIPITNILEYFHISTIQELDKIEISMIKSK